MEMLAYTPVEFNYLEVSQDVYHSRWTKPIHCKNAPVGRIALVGPVGRKKTLHSLNCTLKDHSGINNLISDKLEYSDVVSQSYALIFLIIVAYMLRQ